MRWMPMMSVTRVITLLQTSLYSPHNALTLLYTTRPLF
jgi:hypothetical protein